MSDITTPSSNANPSGTRVTDGAASVTRDPQQNAQQRQESAQRQATEQASESLPVRDPAITIAPSTAGLNIGDNVDQQVNRIDGEGRPIIVTEFATFALRPDAGLQAGDDVNLQIVEANRQILADLRGQNARIIDPPIRLELVIVALNGSASAPPISQNSQIDANAPPITQSNTISTATSQILDTQALDTEAEQTLRNQALETQIPVSGITDRENTPPLSQTSPLQEQTGERVIQVSGLSQSGEPLIVTDFATYSITSSLALEAGDDISIDIIGPSTAIGQIQATITDINTTALREPVTANLTQLATRDVTTTIPQNETEALALAARQSELVAGNIQQVTSTAARETATTTSTTAERQQITIPTISLSEADRTLPTRSVSPVVQSDSAEQRSETFENTGQQREQQDIQRATSISKIERLSVSSDTARYVPTATTTVAAPRNSENIPTSFQVQQPDSQQPDERVSRPRAERQETVVRGEREQTPENAQQEVRQSGISTQQANSIEQSTSTDTNTRQTPESQIREDLSRENAAILTTTRQATPDTSVATQNLEVAQAKAPTAEASTPTTASTPSTLEVTNVIIQDGTVQPLINPTSQAETPSRPIKQNITTKDVNLQNTPVQQATASNSAETINTVSNDPALRNISTPDTSAPPIPSVPTIVAGTIIDAFTLAGAPQTLEVLDLATSTANPATIAQINSFTPLPIEETRSLALPITAFASLSTELAKIETSQGPFILPSNIAQKLIGETVTISGSSDFISEQSAQIPFSTSGTIGAIEQPTVSTNKNTQINYRPEQQTFASTASVSTVTTASASTPTIGTPIISEQPAALTPVSGLGGFLQNLETLPAQITPTSQAAETHDIKQSNSVSSQSVSVAFLPQSAIEQTAINSAQSAGKNSAESAHISSGALSQIASLADANHTDIRQNVSERETTPATSATTPSVPIGPTRITDINVTVQDTGAVAETNTLTLTTPNGILTLAAAPQFSPSIGDIAIILPSLNEDDAALLASQTLSAFGKSISNTSPYTPQLDLVALTAWPALSESVSILNQQSTPNLENITTKSAQGGKALTNGVLFFLNAARLGSPSAWIGNQSEETLEEANSRLLDTLKRDVSGLINAANDVTNEWRPISIPFDVRGNDIPFITMLLKNDPDQHRDQNGEDADQQQHERFVVEIDFKNIGTIQLDGFVKGQNFDLTLRSKADLPPGLATELKHLFKTAVDANGFNGALFIEQQTTFSVNVQDALSKSMKSTTSNTHSS
jgi:hypothetical protein